MEEFKIKSYAKAELAMLYFPDAASKHTAVSHLMSWIKRNTRLWQQLHEQGYNRNAKFFSSREVTMIVEAIGEP